MIQIKSMDIPEVWNLMEAQAKTGLGRLALMRVLDSGHIKYRQIGRRYYINAKSLLEYISCTGKE